MNIQVNAPYFRRWDVLRVSSAGSECIVTEFVNRDGECKITVMPYNPPKNKYLKFFYVLWIKLKAHYQ